MMNMILCRKVLQPGDVVNVYRRPKRIQYCWCCDQRQVV